MGRNGLIVPQTALFYGFPFSQDVNNYTIGGCFRKIKKVE
jgi:hypothetical protein